jgi:hypothetical protein
MEERRPPPTHRAAPMSRSASLTRPLTVLEGVGCEVGWKSGAFVGHVQLQPLAVLRGRNTDRVGSVSEGVLDQVAERLLDPESVDLSSRRVGRSPVESREQQEVQRLSR